MPTSHPLRHPYDSHAELAQMYLNEALRIFGDMNDDRCFENLNVAAHYLGEAEERVKAAQQAVYSRLNHLTEERVKVIEDARRGVS